MMAIRIDELPHALAVVAGYLRISEDEDDLEWGIGRQRKIILAACVANGLPEPSVWYVDNDRSAKRGVYREAFEKLLVDVANGRVNTVVAKVWDRYERNGADRERILTAAQTHNVNFIAAQGGISLDLRSHHGALVARILGAVGEMERDEISQRCSDNQAERADEGEFAGGPIPYGFASAKLPNGHSTLVLVDAEAECIKRIAREILAGESLNAIARAFNAEGISPPRRSKAAAAQWSRTVIRNVVIKPAVAGIRVHQGKEHGKASWDPILDVNTWRLVRTKLSDPARRKKGPTFRNYLLTGLVCNAKGELARAHAKNGVPYYEAPGCKVRAEFVEDVVVGAFFDAVDRGFFGTMADSVNGDGDAANVADELATLIKLDGEIADMGERAGLDEDDPRYVDEVFAMAKVRKLRERKRELEKVVATRTATLPSRFATVAGSASELRRVWNDPETTTAARREILATVIEKVEIFPRGGDRRVRVVSRREGGGR